MNKNRFIRFAALFIAILMSLSLFAACDGDDGEGETTAAPQTTNGEKATSGENDTTEKVESNTTEAETTAIETTLEETQGTTTETATSSTETVVTETEENVTGGETAESATADTGADSSETETETETETVACKHRNAGVDYERGCIIWCPDCESQVGEKTRHKNEIKYIVGEGYYEVCKNCGTKTGDGADYLIEWNAESLGGQKLGKFEDAIVGVYNAEGNYTRFEGNGQLFEGQFNVVPAEEFNTTVAGQYLLIKYRSNVNDYTNPDDPKKIYSGALEIYCGTESAAPGQGMNVKYDFVCDNEWHIVVIDLSGGKYAPDVDGNYVPKHIRLDIINPNGAPEVKNEAGEVIYTYPALPAGYYVDIGLIAMCDDPEAFVAYFEKNEADKEFCEHYSKFVDGECAERCSGCGKYIADKHTYDCTSETVEGENKYVMTCVRCSKKLEYSVSFGEKAPNLFLDPKYLADAVAGGNRMGETEFFVEDGNGFVRLHANTAADREANFMLINSGSAEIAGQYMVIKYRTTCNYAWEIFAGGEGTAPGSGGHFYIENFPADGEWQLWFVDMVAKNAFTVNKDGKCVAGHFRWDIFNTPSAEPRHIDIAYVAFADDMDTLKAINGDFAEFCNHGKLQPGFALVTDEDESTNKAMKKGVCMDCGAEVVTELNRKFFLDDLLGSGDANSRDAAKFDLGLAGYTAASDNSLAIKGWFGVDFGSDAIAYKVYDKDGNLLSGDWKVFENATFTTPTAENSVTKIVVETGVDGAHARRFDYLTIDLTEYFAQSDNLTVEYAFVINGVPEGSNDIYADFLTVSNIKAAQQ